jgi:hypothetical protein
MKAAADAAAALNAVRKVARVLSREDLPTFLGELERVRAEILLQPVTPVTTNHTSDNGDRALRPSEAAPIIGRSTDWVYRHRHELPTTRLSSGRWVVSEARLRCWLDARSKR